jgi:hypothetical protein
MAAQGRQQKFGEWHKTCATHLSFLLDVATVTEQAATSRAFRNTSAVAGTSLSVRLFLPGTTYFAFRSQSRDNSTLRGRSVRGLSPSLLPRLSAAYDVQVQGSPLLVRRLSAWRFGRGAECSILRASYQVLSARDRLLRMMRRLARHREAKKIKAIAARR